MIIVLVENIFYRGKLKGSKLVKENRKMMIKYIFSGYGTFFADKFHVLRFLCIKVLPRNADLPN